MPHISDRIVTQPVALDKTYASEGAQQGQLGDHQIQQGEHALPRAQRVKGSWQMFKENVSQTGKHIKEFFMSSSAKVANRRAERFNAMHEGFSQRVGDLVSQLKTGSLGDYPLAGGLKTLRHDSALMKSDNPMASHQALLSARLDVELNGASNGELNDLVGALYNLDESRLSSADKADLQLMRQAALRQMLARGPEMQAMLGALDTDDPASVTNKGQLLQALQDTMDELAEIKRLFPSLGDSDPVSEIYGAVKLRLQRDGADGDTLKAMNRNLLNVSNEIRADIKGDKGQDCRTTDIEIHRFNPALRALARGVRSEMLIAMADRFNDSQLTSRMVVLGSGAAHSVFQARYGEGDQAQMKVFKHDDELLGASKLSDPPRHFLAPRQVGIDHSSPRLLERAVVTSRFDEALGFGVTTKTDFSTHGGEIGLVMDLASGKTAHDTFLNPESPEGRQLLQRELTKLQLLDIITGQMDRHGGNYMVDVDENLVARGIKGIDSDFCMGPDWTDLDSEIHQYGPHLQKYPSVVDSGMKAAIDQFGPDDIDRLCDGLFADKTIAAAKTRLQNLKDHLDRLQTAGRVIEPDQWGSEQVTTAMQEGRETFRPAGARRDVTLHSGYWARDFDMSMQQMQNKLFYMDL
jgi:hypothetical protein